MGNKIKIAVISIGNELLRGFTVNTNLTYIGSELLKKGFDLTLCITVNDDKEEISQQLDFLFNNNFDIIITTGGLGPTVDDITSKTIADYLNIEMKINENIKKNIQQYWQKRKCKKIPESVYNQALIPADAEILPNHHGTAPGIYLQHCSKTSRKPVSIFLLPGPPRELKPIFSNKVLPAILKIYSAQTFCKTLAIRNMPESLVEEQSSGIANDKVKLAYCASYDSVKIYISGKSQKEVEKAVSTIEKKLKLNLLPDGIFTPAEYLVALLIKYNISFSSAESCTGGMIASAITDVPGASKCFKGSVVSYANEWKNQLLHVSNETLLNYGAVSKECVTEMLKVAELYNTVATVAVTGIAGPEGGTEQKPVGTVFIAVKYKDIIKSEKFLFSGSRESIRIKARNNAFNMLINIILINHQLMTQTQYSDNDIKK